MRAARRRRTPAGCGRSVFDVLTGAVVTDVRGKHAQVSGCPHRRWQQPAYQDRSSGDRGGGWNPAIGPGQQSGRQAGLVRTRSTASCSTRRRPGMAPIGSAAGRFLNSRRALDDGAREAMSVAADLGFAASAAQVFRASDDHTGVMPLWHVGARKPKPSSIFSTTVTDSDIDLAAREGFTSVEHMKRYTTLGMATDQGKTGQLNGHALLAAATGKTIAEAGTILVAATLSAGRDRCLRRASPRDAFPPRTTYRELWLGRRARCNLRRYRPMETGAVVREAGRARLAGNGEPRSQRNPQWRRHLRRPRRSARSTFMARTRRYCSTGCTSTTFSTLPIGKARYGVMLREDGLVMDDGTTTRFAEDRFFVTTTTVNAAKVMQHIDYARQVIWPNVQATSVTEQWTTYAVAGPALARTAAIHAARSGSFPTTPFPTWPQRNSIGRTSRHGFSASRFPGELGYEFSVPAHHGDRLIRALFDAGRAFDAVPYGSEALGVMRVEKGHAAGNELNGETTAGDLGFGRMMSRKKDFIGRGDGAAARIDRSGAPGAGRPSPAQLKWCACARAGICCRSAQRRCGQMIRAM